MKSFSLSLLLRYVIILTLSVTLPSTSLATPANALGPFNVNDPRCFEAIAQYWQELEEIIIQNCTSIVEYFESIFFPSDNDATKPKFNYDVTLVGFVNFADGIGRHPILFKECLGKSLKINFLSTRDIPAEIEDAQLGLPRLDLTHKEDIGAVSILTDILSDKAVRNYKKMPDSPIKIAYTMFESTRIPQNWVQILNNEFDAAIVPDSFLVNVYKKCGVQIPIFVLPLPLKLHEFLELKQQTIPHTPFVFGTTGALWARKNHIRVLEAFAAEFGNRQDVKLRLHGRFGEEKIIEALNDKIAELQLTNVELIVRSFSWEEYLEFFKSLDCYVFLSQGEGFSITPREALACGKPCIVTNNTAQKSICNSGTVRVVPSNILIPAIYDCHYEDHNSNYGNQCKSSYHTHYQQNHSIQTHGQTHAIHAYHNKQPIPNIIDEEIELSIKSTENLGYHFDCTVQDAQEAMRDVFQHYNYYLAKARKGREWVKRYLQENLKHKYVNLVKPESIILGEENIIVDQFLMTNSQALYDKYQYILGNTCTIE